MPPGILIVESTADFLSCNATSVNGKSKFWATITFNDMLVGAALRKRSWYGRQESTYTAPDDWVWASLQKQGKQPLWLATIMRYYIQPAARRAGINKKIGWHTFRHTFSSLIKSLGVDARVVQELLRHASFKTTMDAYTQALEPPKRQAQQALADLIMRTGKIAHA